MPMIPDAVATRALEMTDSLLACEEENGAYFAFDTRQQSSMLWIQFKHTHTSPFTSCDPCKRPSRSGLVTISLRSVKVWCKSHA